MNELQAIELMRGYEAKYTTGLSLLSVPKAPPLISASVWGAFAPAGGGGTLSSLEHTVVDELGFSHHYPAHRFTDSALASGMDVVIGCALDGRKPANPRATISAIADYLLTFSTPIVDDGIEGYAVTKYDPPRTFQASPATRDELLALVRSAKSAGRSFVDRDDLRMNLDQFAAFPGPFKLIALKTSLELQLFATAEGIYQHRWTYALAR